MSDKNEHDDNNNDGDDEVTGVTDEALLDAVSSGIAEVSDEPTGDDDGNTDDDTGTDEGGAEGEGASDKDAADDKAAGDGDDDTDDGGSDTDTDDKDDEGGEGGEDDGAEKGAAGDGEGSADAGEGEDDPINDPIPDELNDKTSKRIQSLIGIAKEQTEVADQGREIMAAIESTGANPDQYAATLGFIKLFNSTKPEDRRNALAAARNVVRELSIELGEGTASVLNLQDYEDLQAEVEAGSLTEARAIEIATQRERTKLQQARDTAAADRQNSDAETARLVATGRDQLNNLEATLDGSDPSYKALRPTFLNMLRPVLRRTSPNEWGAVAQELYTQLRAANPQPPTAAPAKPAPTNTPLRPRGDSGNSNGKQSQPSSGLDALNAALDTM